LPENLPRTLVELGEPGGRCNEAERIMMSHGQLLTRPLT
jgi:hypothetical protein